MTEDNGNERSAWGTLVGALGGAALGYWAGQSNSCGNRNCGCGYNGYNYGVGFGYPAYAASVAGTAMISNGFNEFEAGKTQAELTAGLNYTAQTNAAIRRDITDLSAQMNANFQRLEDRQFNMLLAENTNLKSDLNTARTVWPITNQLTGLNGTVDCISRAFMPGYVRSVPLCNTAVVSTATATA